MVQRDAAAGPLRSACSGRARGGGFRLPPAGPTFPLRSPSKHHVKYNPRTMTLVFFQPDVDQSILNALGGWVSIGATSKTMIPHIILPQIGLPYETKSNMPSRETTVFGKHHTGRPLCSDPMIQLIILPQIGLPQDKYFKHAIQGDHCVWETPYRETTVFNGLGNAHDPTVRFADLGPRYALTGP